MPDKKTSSRWICLKKPAFEQETCSIPDIRLSVVKDDHELQEPENVENE